MKRLVQLLAVAAFALPAPSLAAPEQAWTPIGPEGGHVWEMAVAPSNPLVTYAAISQLGLLRTSDGGRTWHSFETPPGAYPIFDVHPQSAGTFFASSPDALWVTRDGGATWSRLATPPYRINDLSFNHVRPAVVYGAAGGTPARVLKSTDGG